MQKQTKISQSHRSDQWLFGNNYSCRIEIKFQTKKLKTKTEAGGGGDFTFSILQIAIDNSVQIVKKFFTNPNNNEANYWISGKFTLTTLRLKYRARSHSNATSIDASIDKIK